MTWGQLLAGLGAHQLADDFIYSRSTKTVRVVFSPGSEGLSLVSCGLGRPCGTHRHRSPIRSSQDLPFQCSLKSRKGHQPQLFDVCARHLQPEGAPERGTDWRGPGKCAWESGHPIWATALLGQESRERNPSAAGMLWRQQLLLGFRCPLSSRWRGAPAPRSLALGPDRNLPTLSQEADRE
jgi:hypothetical protein